MLRNRRDHISGVGFVPDDRKVEARNIPAMAAVWTLQGLIEVPYLLAPTLGPLSRPELCVIGDSVTAGDPSDHWETWPTLLGRQHNLQVQDLSHVGDTAGAALRRLEATSITAPLVLVEIGGNDLLGTTTSSQFGHDLDRLLGQLSAPGRQIIMFELPLPPFIMNTVDYSARLPGGIRSS